MEHERDEIREEAARLTKEALRKRDRCLYGWIDSDNPDGIATYMIAICREE